MAWKAVQLTRAAQTASGIVKSNDQNQPFWPLFFSAASIFSILLILVSSNNAKSEAYQIHQQGSLLGTRSQLTNWRIITLRKNLESASARSISTAAALLFTLTKLVAKLNASILIRSSGNFDSPNWRLQLSQPRRVFTSSLRSLTFFLRANHFLYETS